jgi:hypothetical protein
MKYFLRIDFLGAIISADGLLLASKAAVIFVRAERLAFVVGRLSSQMLLAGSDFSLILSRQIQAYAEPENVSAVT